MNISVILCTYNRSQILAQTLENLAVSRLPESIAWEVLVMDNNSNDSTRVVVENFCRRYPERFRYLFEAQPGKSYALNAGVRAARGEILAFMDDDVTVEPSWLKNLTAELDGEEWAGAGGRTLPSSSFQLPRWLALEGPYSLGGVLAALFDLGDEPVELDQAPYGANMAFQKKMFEKYGGFRIDLGPSPNREIPRPNEDTEFGRRLFSAGERLRYEPSAIAYHPVPEGRIKKDYFLAWWFDYGRATIREIDRRPDIWGIPRRYFSISKIVGTLLVPRTLRWLFALHPQSRFYRKCRVWATTGQVLEIHHLWRDIKGQENDATQDMARKYNGRT
jgi:glycosyltransferase involved in cell wall biosynthesis